MYISRVDSTIFQQRIVSAAQERRAAKQRAPWVSSTRSFSSPCSCWWAFCTRPTRATRCDRLHNLPPFTASSPFPLTETDPTPLPEHPFVVAKALESNRTDAAAEWLTYWVTFSLFTVIELVGGSLLSWIPFYSFLKLGFLSWLLLPKFKGASKLYQSGVQPLIRKHEAKIDQGLNQGYETAMSFQKNGLAAITQRFTSSGQRTN